MHFITCNIHHVQAMTFIETESRNNVPYTLYDKYAILYALCIFREKCVPSLPACYYKDH